MKKPQANALVERTHLTMGNKLRTTIFEGEDWKSDLDQELQTTAWAIRSTINSTSKHSPSHLALGRDMIFQTKVKINWESIKSNKRKLAIENNTRENLNRIDHNYNVGDKVLISKIQIRTEGPYEIIQVYNNGTVKINKGSYNEIINIRRIKPYYEKQV